jgi:aromatic ring hydroxylase
LFVFTCVHVVGSFHTTHSKFKPTCKSFVKCFDGLETEYTEQKSNKTRE